MWMDLYFLIKETHFKLGWLPATTSLRNSWNRDEQDGEIDTQSLDETSLRDLPYPEDISPKRKRS